jgi:tetratricopeptide (TPR) repeat protein
MLQLAGEGHLAEAHFRIALTYQPMNPTAHFNLGVALEDQGRLPDARKSYAATISADPTFADAYFNLARLLEQLGESQAALRHLKTYRKLIDAPH